MKFLENPNQTMIAGFVLAAVLAVGWLAVSGASPTPDAWVETMLRWVHYLAGITWIGLLYFFNLINAGFLKSLEGPTKNAVIPKLMPAALNWFRHGATVTVLAGIGLIVTQHPTLAGTGDKAAWLGGLLGLIMMGNVHGIIWPNQKKIIAATEAAAAGTPAPPEMAGWAKTALYASRVNFMLSIPMLFFMGAASHLK